MNSELFNRLRHILEPVSASASTEDRLRRLEAESALLRELVVNLMVEVEALRVLAIEDAQSGGEAVGSRYERAYREAALLKHNSAGVVPGVMKLTARFAEEDPWFGELRLLRRLGYTQEQIDEYLEQADHVATYT